MNTFFEILFGDALTDSRRLAIFTLPDTRTRHFSSASAAVLYAAEAAKSQDVYFGVSLSGSNFNHRSTQQDIAALMGLWADIDLAAPYRQGKLLPKAVEEVQTLLAGLPYLPTLQVHSGSGIHAYWLFKEPWILESTEARAHAARVTKGWHGLVCSRAAQSGWNLENLGDLPRVLRVPGTFNRKCAPPAAVHVLEEQLERRYNLSDFEPYCEWQSESADPTPVLELRENAQPPLEKFARLTAQCPAFLNAWERKRPELKDQSQSGYDLCLANIAALNDWTDQEIADLIIATRVKHAQNPQKALRADYMSRTIFEARRAANERTGEEGRGVDLSGILNPRRNIEIASAETLTPTNLFDYDTSNDPNTLIGNRWLCRGGSCLVIGQTGIGKSSFSVQAAVSWALGKSLFGIAPVRPLRSLIVQAENDTGDLAEMFRGVLHGTGCVPHLKELDSRLRFITTTKLAGEWFHPWVRERVIEHSPDLVWIDPLFAFIGGNVSDQELVSTFLRNGLGPIGHDTGAAWMIVHHTNKPPKQTDGRMTFVPSDFAYLGAGSAELANWARAVLTVRDIGGGIFELRASKRGRRSGLSDADEKPAGEIYLKHGEIGICWERSNKPEDQRTKAENSLADDVMAAMKPGQNYSEKDVRELVEKTLGVKRTAVIQLGRRANRVYSQVLERTRVDGKPDCHSVTSCHKGLL